ncbi:glycosyltransferase family 2 protein [Streptococcus marmotae]|uniref:glycosyltransferase family 2 protein n=1 Tax=Streptococcus marmotae TaxID=1825069 RepID=UPI0009EE9E5A|nr:glycosyltransferase family 2 protein [Streptococcus marmotae]
MEKAVKTISIGIIALNEENYLPTLLETILQQTYKRKAVEVILVDSLSTDNTKKMMSEFQKQYGDEFLDVKVFDNPNTIQSSGWNVVLNHFTCDAVLRIDAHAELPKNFIEENVNCLNTGEFVCGGPRTNIIDSDSLWKQSLLHVEQSLFGSGFASYRREDTQKKYVKSVFHGAYRREVIETVGLFNEQLVRTEDNEYHYRIQQAGYQIRYMSSIQSYYQTRNSLLKMIVQKYLNGLWIGKTIKICPQCISLFHLIPMVFVLSLIVALLLAVFHLPQVLILIAGLYSLVMMTSAFQSFWRTKNGYDFFIPIGCLAIHIAYGFGTILGIFQRA